MIEWPSFFNPIAFDAKEITWFASILGDNYSPSQAVIPRQCWELFKLKRSYDLNPLDLTRKTDINVFITKKVYAVYPLDNVMDSYIQVAATLDNDPVIWGFSRRDNYERIDNREYSGIVLTQGEFLADPHPLSFLELDLAHEIGHILMGIGDEHNRLGSTLESTENLMGQGRKLNELQFLATFDYKKGKDEKRIMMVEE